MITEESSKVTVDRGAKKVEVYHLCACLTSPSLAILADAGPHYLMTSESTQ